MEIRKDSISSELRRRLNAAAENGVRKVFGVVVVQGFDEVGKFGVGF